MHPPRQGRAGLLGVLRGDATRRRQTSSRGLPLRDALRRLSAIARQRSLVTIVSDFRGALDWRLPLLELAGQHDVLAVEIRDPREQGLAPVGELWLIDAETGRRLRVDTNDTRLRKRFAARGRRGARPGRQGACVVRRRPRRPLDRRRLAAAARRLPAEEAPVSFAWPLALALLAVLPLAVWAWIAADRAGAARRGAFGNPALLPGLVDAKPGRRRWVPPLILLGALALLVVGLARPHAVLPVKREEATVVLVMDASRSMSATDVQPTPDRRRAEVRDRLHRARAGQVPRSRSSPSRRRRRSCCRRPPTGMPRARRWAAAPRLRDCDRRRDRARAHGGLAARAAGSPAAPADSREAARRRTFFRRRSSCSPTGRRPSAACTPVQAAQRARRAGSAGQHDRARERATPASGAAAGGLKQLVAVPPDPRDAAACRRGDRRPLLRGAQRGAARGRLPRARLRLGSERRRVEVTSYVGGRRGAAAPGGRRALVRLVPEGAVSGRACSASPECSPLLVAASDRGTGAAVAGRERVPRAADCVPIAGPWVCVPAAVRRQRRRSSTCVAARGTTSRAGRMRSSPTDRPTSPSVASRQPRRARRDRRSRRAVHRRLRGLGAGCDSLPAARRLRAGDGRRRQVADDPSPAPALCRRPAGAAGRSAGRVTVSRSVAERGIVTVTAARGGQAAGRLACGRVQPEGEPSSRVAAQRVRSHAASARACRRPR